MGWMLCDTTHGEHEGFVELVARVDEGPRWVPVVTLEGLNFGRTEISSDELVSGVWSIDHRRRVLVYRVQVACECGWRSPLLIVPLGATWTPCSIELDARDEAAAYDLWRRFHVDHLDEWPASLTQAWPKADV